MKKKKKRKGKKKKRRLKPCMNNVYRRYEIYNKPWKSERPVVTVL